MNARRAYATIAGSLLGVTIATAALAQKQGGILRVQHRDSPASMSILEEGTISAIMPMMGVQQSRPVRSAGAAEPGGIDRPGPRDELVVKRGWD